MFQVIPLETVETNKHLSQFCLYEGLTSVQKSVVKQTVTLFTSAGRPFNWYAFTILSDMLHLASTVHPFVAISDKSKLSVHFLLFP
jgi:hypothetical protein